MVQSKSAIAALTVIFVVGMVLQGGSVVRAEETREQRDARMAWWREAKFGMFIHWGVYSVPAGKYKDKDTYGEWIMNSAKIPVAEYAEYAKKFNPVKFNAEQWVKIARDAGQKYIVITSKHHDGFAMFQSRTSDYNIYDATPFKRDPLKELAAACEKEGIKLGFYYSQAQDWHHPGGAASGGHWDKAQDGSFDDYLDRIALPQVKEILSNYGHVSVLWFDTPMQMTAAQAAKFKPLLQLQPGLIVNNRLGGGVKGDTETPEQFVPSLGYPGRDWETCMTLNGHWGYCAADTNWKSTEDLIHKLADIAQKGGNFLLNVGPTSEGEIPAGSVDRLKEVGAWMKVNGESIYGTSAGPFAYLSWGRCTRKGGMLYLHVFEWPKDGVLRVPVKNKIAKAYLLADAGTALKCEADDAVVKIQLPATAPDAIDTVVAVQIEGEPQTPAPPARGKPAIASSTQKGYDSAKAFDGAPDSRWVAGKDDRKGWIEVDLGQPTLICHVTVDEPVRWDKKDGQKLRLQYKDGDSYKTIAEGKTEHRGFSKSFTPVKAQIFRLEIVEAKDSPAICEMQLFSPE